jgi:hypothetical protein
MRPFTTPKAMRMKKLKTDGLTLSNKEIMNNPSSSLNQDLIGSSPKCERVCKRVKSRKRSPQNNSDIEKVIHKIPVLANASTLVTPL